MQRRLATLKNGPHRDVAIACRKVTAGTREHLVVRYVMPAGEIEDLCDYFDTCRRKRNDIDYNFAVVITNTEFEEILSEVSEYRELIEDE